MTNWTGGTVSPVHGLDQPTTVPIDLARLRTASTDRSLIREMKEAERPPSFYAATYDCGEVCTALNAAFSLGLDRKYYEPKALNKKLKKILK